MTTQEITAYIRGFVPTAQLICHTQYELSYILPKKCTVNVSFKNLFESLEANKDQLGSQSFGLTDTTMEEVCVHLFYESFWFYSSFYVLY